MEIQKLFVTLALEAKEYAQGLRGAASQAADVGRNIGASMQQAGKVMATALAAGALAVGAAFVGIGVAAFNVASDVQSATVGIQAQLGLSADEAAAFGDVIKNVYGNNFGGSIEEVGSSVAAVALQFARLGETSTEVIEAATVNAYRLADAYGIEVTESTAAAAALMDEFGLSQQQAFDFITTGMQRGLNSSDDFLDSIGEYAPQFAGLGFDAAHFFSVMETGMASGVLGTDKIADSVKEWGIIMTTEADRSRDALATLGMDYDAMEASVASGEAVWADYFGEIVSGLQSIEDPVLQQQTVIELFGTMAEDMGAGFLDGLSMMFTGLDEMAGSTAALDVQYDTLGSAIEGFKRQGLLALEPIGAILLGLANAVMPKIEEAFAKLEPVIATIGEVVGSFVANLEEGMTPLDAFIEAIWEIAPQSVLDALVNLRDNIIPALGEAFNTYIQPIIDWVAENIKLSDALIAIGAAIMIFVVPALLSMMLAALPIVLAIVALVLIVALLRTAWEENWGGIQEKTAAAWEYIKEIFGQLSAWVTDTLLPKLQELYDKWVTEVWPAIQTALATAWEYILDVFTQLSDWVTGTLIPTLQELYDKWVTEVWPTIQTVLQNVWVIIKEVFEELGRWINKNIVPWIEHLSKEWSKKWADIQSKLSEVWGVVEPIFILIKDWMEKKIQEAITSFGAKWDEIMSALTGPIETAKSVWDGFVQAVQGFWDWISNKVFSFDISLPDLPDWALPGSPLPIHTAWKNFGQDMSRMIIEPEIVLPNMVDGASNVVSPMANGGAAGGNSYSANTTVNVAAGDDPLRALRAARLLDALGGV